MSVSNNTKSLLMAFGAALALAGCGGGADKIVSPGIPANPPPTVPPPPPPAPPPAPPAGETAVCPSGTIDQGTFANGVWRACRLPSQILGTLTLSKVAGVAYQIQGQVNVGQDQLGDKNVNDTSKKGVLNIGAGVTLFGSSGPDVLLVQRGSQLFALGTRAAPITFTSRQGLEGSNSAGKYNWGGVVVMGRAPVTECTGGPVYGDANCQGAVEGVSNAFGGGNDPTDNSGEITYTRILNSGFVLGTANELQSLTLVGVGNGTKIDYFQSHFSGDDGIEIFGGTVNLKHIVISEADDDGVDVDWGWNGGIQHGLVIRKTRAVKTPGDSGSGFEWSTASNRSPNTEPKVANITIYSTDPGLDTLVKINSSTRAHIWNSVFVAAPTTNEKRAEAAFLFDSNITSLELLSNYFASKNRFNENVVGAITVDAASPGRYSTALTSDAGTVFNTTSTLNPSTFVPGANENAVTAINAKARYAFFDTTTYIGAVKDANDTWWQGWTVGL